jgi:hypothetical protein
MNGYDLIPSSNRTSLRQAYETAKNKNKKETILRQKACVDECLQIIENALLGHNNCYELLKVNLIQVPHIDKQIIEEVSKELNQLEIVHSYRHYSGCQRENPEAYFLIKLN